MREIYILIVGTSNEHVGIASPSVANSMARLLAWALGAAVGLATKRCGVQTPCLYNYWRLISPTLRFLHPSLLLFLWSIHAYRLRLKHVCCNFICQDWCWYTHKWHFFNLKSIQKLQKVQIFHEHQHQYWQLKRLISLINNIPTKVFMTYHAVPYCPVIAMVLCRLSCFCIVLLSYHLTLG